MVFRYGWRALSGFAASVFVIVNIDDPFTCVSVPENLVCKGNRLLNIRRCIESEAKIQEAVLPDLLRLRNDHIAAMIKNYEISPFYFGLRSVHTRFQKESREDAISTGQIIHDRAGQNHMHIFLRFVIHKPVQIRLLRNGEVQLGIYCWGINRQHTAIGEDRLHRGGVDIEFTKQYFHHKNLTFVGMHKKYRSVPFAGSSRAGCLHSCLQTRYEVV